MLFVVHGNCLVQDHTWLLTISTGSLRLHLRRHLTLSITTGCTLHCLLWLLRLLTVTLHRWLLWLLLAIRARLLLAVSTRLLWRLRRRLLLLLLLRLPVACHLRLARICTSLLTSTSCSKHHNQSFKSHTPSLTVSQFNWLTIHGCLGLGWVR